MKTLLILRHAKSSWGNAHLSDHDRPLNKRGKRDAPRMGQLLKQEDIVPDLIISSTANRAHTTAKEAANACGYDLNDLHTTREFYHAAPGDYVELLRSKPEAINTIMVVGHNPGMADLVEGLSGEFARMPTAALAQIDLPISKWGELSLDESGELVGYWEPKGLADLRF